jgi:hypothetical protein
MTFLGSRIRSRMMTAGVLCVAAALSGAALTDAAWVDTEYVHAPGIGTDGRCEQDSGTPTTASARQLSGTLLGQNLDNLASVGGVRVFNDGAGTSTANPEAISIDADTFMAPLDVNAVNEDLFRLALPLGLPVGAADLYSQWGQTLNNGNATAASGLVTNSSGAIGLGEPSASATPPEMATLDLEALVPTDLAGLVLEVGAVSSLARLTQCGELGNGWLGPLEQPLVNRQYNIHSLDLTTVLSALNPTVAGPAELLESVQPSLDAAVQDAELRISEDLALAAAPLLGTLSLGDITTVVTVTPPDLAPLQALLTSPLTDRQGLLTVDLQAGTVQINLAKALGSVNNRDPNTELVLNQAVMNELSAALNQALGDWQENVTRALADAIRATSVTVASTVNVTSGTIPVAVIHLGLGPVPTGQMLDLHTGVPGTPAVPVTTSVEMLVSDDLGTLTAAVNDLAAGLASALPGITGEALHNELVGGVVADYEASLAELANFVESAHVQAFNQLSSQLSIMVNVQPDKPGHPQPVTPNPFQVSALRLSVPAQGTTELSLATSSTGSGG